MITATTHDGMKSADTPKRIGAVVLLVALVAVAINALAASATQLWASPDTSYYVALAGGIADHGDFANELFLIRPPGYPLLLAAIFRTFGSASPTAIHLLQHAMVVLIAVVTTMTAWHLSHHRLLARLAGLMTACSLQLMSYADVIMPEVPYALALSLSVYFVVKYHRLGYGRWLALASASAGVSYLLRPTGMSMVAICIAAGVYKIWTEGAHKRWMRLGSTLALATLPALLVAAPANVQNRIAHGADTASRCAGLALYHRAYAMDKLDAPNSAALAEIRSVVAEAADRGFLRPRDDIRQWGTVRKAYAEVKGMSLAESATVMGEAAKDAMRTHAGPTIEKTIRYAFWMLLAPDTLYRFLPGGAPRDIKPSGECVRSANAEIFDSATYRPMLGQWIDPFAHYLPLDATPRAATPAWTAIVRWFHRNVATGPPWIGFGDSPHEELRWLVLIGVVASLFVRERMTWLLVSGAVGLQVLASAFLAGPTPRYAVPLIPLLLLYAGLLVVLVARAVVLALSFHRRSRASGRPATSPRLGSA